MMPRSDRSAALRVLLWGLVAIVLVLTTLAGVMVVRQTSGLVGRVTGPPAPPRITQQVVVDRLQTVAKLVASEMTLRDVVTYQQTRFGSTKRALLVVTGRVSAGIDLTQGSEVHIDSAARKITVTLPPAKVFGVDVLDVTTYDERAGLLNPFRPEDRDAIHRMVREKLITAARESGILTHADRSADRALTELLTQDGYTVEIVRPMVVNKPTG
ncbi:MAG: hypothetical protein DMD35_18625 [Gemmatimonadetes bacterium]|nr:MAG: hypothetical protein DMD35_18625 [Gemmatimonadota bacterium]